MPCNETSARRLTYPFCPLCHKQSRSLYALPGESGTKLCAACFFSTPPTVDPLPGTRKGSEDA